MVGRKPLGRQRVRCSRKVSAARQAVLVTSLLAMEAGQTRIALARLGDWKPVLSNYSASLTLQSTYTTDDRITNRGPSQKETIKSFRESAEIRTIGYVYHPDLMLFSMSGTLGTDQSDNNVNDRHSRAQGGFDGYELESVILRAKPYNLELFTRKDNPYNFLSTVQSGEVEYESSADFKYLQDAHRARMKFHNTTRERTRDSNEVDTLDTYYDFSRPTLGKLNNFALNSSARYQEDATANREGYGGTTTTEQGNLSNSFGYSIFTFNSNISNITTAFDEDSNRSSYDYDTLGFNEGVSIRLPWNFDSRVEYGNIESTSKNKNSSAHLAPTEENPNPITNTLGESTTDSENLDFTLTQSLYDSLETEFSSRNDKSTTTRSGENTTLNGSQIPEFPVDGLDETNDYGVLSRYRKLLPHNSLLTASLSSRNVETKRSGMNLETIQYPRVGTNDLGEVTFKLTNDPDTTQQISVFILKEKIDDLPSDTSATCSDAFSHTGGQDVKGCWIELLRPGIDYELDPITLEITADISAIRSYYPDFDTDPDNPLGNDGPFNFLVTNYRQAADYTDQTNQLNTGLQLFEFITSNYQHTVSTREGTYGNAPVESTTSDYMSLGCTLHDWSFSSARRWFHRESDTSVGTELTALYTKSRKFWNKLTVRLDAGATKEWADYEYDASVAASDTNEETSEGYTYALSGDMPLPYLRASLIASHNYEYIKGTITQYNQQGQERTDQYGIDEQTTFRNSIALKKPFKIPWIDFGGSAYLKYRWQNQLTAYTSNQPDDDKDRSYLSYGLQAGKFWQFGATKINLNARYDITDEIFDNTSRSARNSYSNPETEDETNETSVMLKVVRQLF